MGHHPPAGLQPLVDAVELGELLHLPVQSVVYMLLCRLLLPRARLLPVFPAPHNALFNASSQQQQDICWGRRRRARFASCEARSGGQQQFRIVGFFARNAFACAPDFRAFPGFLVPFLNSFHRWVGQGDTGVQAILHG